MRLLFTLMAFSAVLAACGGTSHPAGLGQDVGSGSSPDAGGASAPDSGDMGGTPDSGTGPMMSVSFRYQPGWPGATQVALVGNFGQATDWMQPLVTLMNDGTGVFSGTANIPVGRYTYLFHVKGDAASNHAANFQRYTIDPANPTVEACPMGSPTFSMNMNPCSVLDLTLGPPTQSPTFHIKGAVNYDGQGVPGYLVEIERVEPHLHHYFVNRATSAMDGTTDIQVAAGHYRFMILHPTFMNETDAQRDPLMLQAARRIISSGFMVMNDVTVPAAEAAYHSYSSMAPRTSTAALLPTPFTLTLNPGQASVRLDVYGSPVGDPFFASRTSTATEVTFDGRFNTTQAKTASVAAGQKYYWGEEQTGPHPAGQVSWTTQSMVFPISW